jgi:ribulose bisphosphate carboxylase small subunit
MNDQQQWLPVEEVAPVATELTDYDWSHRITYLRLVDADAAGADWREVARIVLHLDPDGEPDRAHRIWESHLARAHWMTTAGYRHLLDGANG